MTTAGMTYPQRRAAAIALAAAYDGWGRPPTPEGTPARWRTVWLDRTYGRKRFRVDGKWEWGEGWHPSPGCRPGRQGTTAKQEAFRMTPTVTHADQVALYAGALRMVRDAIEELFGPVASLESEEAVLLLRGPMPHHAAEAIIAALQRVKAANIETMRQFATAVLAHSGEEVVAVVVPTHRHLKRGSEYVLIGYGKMQAELWSEPDGFGHRDSVDMREVAIYQSIDDGSLWARPREEFDDRARFAVLEPSHG